MNLLVKIQNDQRVTSYLWLKGFTQKQANWLYVEKKNLSKRLCRRYDSTPRSTSENVLVFPCLGLGKITPLSLHGTHNCHWNTFLKSTSSSLTTKLSHFAIMMQQSRWIFFFLKAKACHSLKILLHHQLRWTTLAISIFRRLLVHSVQQNLWHLPRTKGLNSKDKLSKTRLIR